MKLLKKQKLVPHIAKSSASDCIVSNDMIENMKKEAGEKGDAKSIAEQEKEIFQGSFDASSPMIDFPFPIMSEYVLENQAHTPQQDFGDQAFCPLKEPVGWSIDLPDNAKVAVVPLCENTVRRHFVVTASDGVHYDTVSIYKNKKDAEPIGVITKDGWSKEIRDVYTKNNEPVHIAYYGRIMSIADDGSSAEILLSHAMNRDDFNYFYPKEIGQKMLDDIGVFTPQVKLGELGIEYTKFELETWERAYQWHSDATHWLFKEYPDWQLFYIHLHGIDIYNHWYINQTLPGWTEDAPHYQEMLAKMYEYNDAYVGEILKYLDEDTNIIITSDHAAIPNSPGDINPGFGALNGIATKVMEDLGYTKLVEGTEQTMKPQIDWSKTKAISSRLTNVYVNLKGRDPQGIVEPEDYAATVNQIIEDLYAYRHPKTGKRLVSFCMTRDEMEMVGMGGKHCGDIFVQLMPTYCETHGNCPSTVEHEGYSLNNLCMMVGPDFKEGETINRVIRITDVVPTICHLTDTAMPSNCEGGVIWQALKGFVEEKY